MLGSEVKEERPAFVANPIQHLDILVAEDTAINRMVVQAMLVKYGHAVTLVEDGEQAR